jgi:hypothetical protein
MFTVIQRMAWVSAYLPSMTVMTLMTVVCRFFLDEEAAPRLALVLERAEGFNSLRGCGDR